MILIKLLNHYLIIQYIKIYIIIQRYEESLQNKMKGSDFEFDGIKFLYYDFNKTSIYRGGTYIDSPK